LPTQQLLAISSSMTDFNRPLSIAQIIGPVPGDPLSLQVRLRDGSVTNLSVTAASSAAINLTIVEYGDVFRRLADE
jgi:hypothetical protein